MIRSVFAFLGLLALLPAVVAAQPVAPDDLWDMEARAFVQARGYGVIIAVRVDAMRERDARLAMEDGFIDDAWLPVEEEGMIEGIREVKPPRDLRWADDVRVFTGVTDYFGTFQTVTLTILRDGSVIYWFYEAGALDSTVIAYIEDCALLDELADAPSGYVEFEYDY